MKTIVAVFLFLASQFCCAQHKIPTEQEAKSFLAVKTNYLETYVISDSDTEYEKYTNKKIGEIVIEGSQYL